MNLLRDLTAIALTIAAAPVIAAGPSHRPALSSVDDRLIRDLETKSWVAWQGHDAHFFEQFLSDDHVEVHGYGIMAKAAVVDGVRSPVCTVKTYSIGPLSLTAVTADTVLVTYRAEQDTTCGSTKVPSPVWATSLYAKRLGRWVNVLYQHTPAANG